MGWHYSGNPGSSLKDQVRFLTGDCNPDWQLLSDEEVNYLLLQAENDATRASIRAIEAILYRLATMAVDESLGPASISSSQAIANFKANLAMLQRRSISGVRVFCGGIDRAQNLANRQDRSLLPLDYDKHMFQDDPARDRRVTQTGRRDE